jgi:hypothetical protein
MFHSEPAAATDSPKPSCADALEARDRERITRYVEQLPGAFGVPAGKVIFLRDSEALRKGLYGTDSSGRNDCSQSRDSQALELLVAEAQRAGMNVVDSLPLFRSHYATTGERVDSSPTDWHWNETVTRSPPPRIHKLMVSGRNGASRTASGKRVVTARNVFYYCAGLAFLALAKTKNALGLLDAKAIRPSRRRPSHSIRLPGGRRLAFAPGRYERQEPSLVGNNILELGPGSDLGIGLLLLARGAAK